MTTATETRKAYQFIQIRVQLLGRGMTNEIMNLYVNGKVFSCRDVNTEM
ncbi:hypothetical protein [Dolichospermum compactum]|uniref:Uncharacterized protein n=1 Tax=Dolichospermum compactum NIES-806 TaxID=1973481 RepID=A0A1Z4V0I6_9CYAN|nr:hypothetical protein [Dolichospermum compactum]BAZ85020.1 hypothetical protein NIES806_12200 [Dolichospermum compactum NIES-806]